MANGRVITGFSDVYVAKYSNTDGTTTYSGGVPLGRGVSLSLDVNFSEDNIFYADNQAAENASGEFSDGTVTITIDGLLGETEALVMGLPAAEEVTIGSGGTKKANVYKYGDSAQAPYVGIGCLQRRRSGGVTTWRGIVLTKAKFNPEAVAAATQEKTIDWQNTPLTAQIFRDDTSAHNWQYHVDDLESQEDAVAVIKQLLNITA